ncbi:hypothetical protein MAR_013992 [Mya arenaria]|uniref:Uncharacterized protein n=1 Tax=Mya arenaria TaxID=6604 RepID=A0ABY7G1F9_MYAAR|nr:hypothetical protein MAR_013992 [Mya arenaria]
MTTAIVESSHMRRLADKMGGWAVLLATGGEAANGFFKGNQIERLKPVCGVGPVRHAVVHFGDNDVAVALRCHTSIEARHDSADLRRFSTASRGQTSSKRVADKIIADLLEIYGKF